jgi:hypothetical protein
MKTNKIISDKQLREAFGRIPLENPSPGFTENLMIKIERKTVGEKRKKNWIVFGQMAAGISGMILLPGLAIYLCLIFIPNFSISFTFEKIHIEPQIFLMGFCILFLLIIDTLLRKHIRDK